MMGITTLVFYATPVVTLLGAVPSTTTVFRRGTFFFSVSAFVAILSAVPVRGALSSSFDKDFIVNIAVENLAVFAFTSSMLVCSQWSQLEAEYGRSGMFFTSSSQVPPGHELQLGRRTLPTADVDSVSYTSCQLETKGGELR